MKKIILLAAIITCSFVKAQERSTALGFRSGYSYGLSLRLYSNNFKSSEALLSFRDRGIQFTVFSEKIMPVLTAHSDHFMLCSGVGGHLGYSRCFLRNYNAEGEVFYKDRAFPLLGIDALFSLEYLFYKIPFIAAIDYKPFTELGGRKFFRLNLWDFGFSIKYLMK
jgi:hypothetical protein